MNFKTIKRFVALFLCLCIIPIMGVAARNDYDDYSEDFGAREFKIVSALGFFEGGKNFRFDFLQAVKRGEFIQMLMSALPFDNQASENKFIDVKEGDLYANAVNSAADMGFISGDNGFFYPENNITGVEAVSVILNVLGYKAYANDMGGYPNGHINVAHKLNLDENLTFSTEEPLSQGEAAMLFYNMLSVEVVDMLQYDGKQVTANSDAKSFMERILSVKKDFGVVSATHKNGNLDGSAFVPRDDEVIIGTTTYKTGNSNADKLFGYDVEYYYKESKRDGEKTVLYCEKSSSNKEVSISSENIESFDGTCYKYRSGDKVRTSPDVLKTCNIIYNGRAVSPDFNKYVPKDGEICMVDSDGKGGYDTLFITDYTITVVGRIDAANYKVFDKYENKVIEIKPDSSEYECEICNKYGEAETFKNIMEYSVLFIAQSEDKKLRKIILSNDQVEGTVSAVYEKSEEVVIGDRKYKIVNSDYLSIETGNYGIFCLDPKERVVAVYKSIDDRIGYIIKVAEMHSGFEDNLKLRIFDQTGKPVDYLGSDKINIDGNIVKGAQNQLAVLKANPYGTVSQMIAFSLNEDGKISEIKTPDPYTDVIKTGSGRLHEMVKRQSTYTYKSWANNFGSEVRANSDTKVFVIPEKEDDTKNYVYQTNGISYFVNGVDYTVCAYSKSYDSPYAEYIVVFLGKDGDAVSIPAEAPLMVVNSVSEVYENEENTYRVRGFAAGAEKSFILPDEEKFTNLHIGPGDVIRYTENTYGEAVAIDKFFDYESGQMTVANPSTSDYIAQRRYLYGSVYSCVPDMAMVSLKGVSGISLKTDVENIFVDRFQYVYKYDADENETEVALQDDIKDYLHNPDDYSNVFVYNWYGDPHTLIIYDRRD